VDLIILRLVHILSGAFWFGSVFTTFVFVQPVVNRMGPEGQRIMVHILRDRRFLDAVLGAALLTGAAGAILFWRDSGGFDLGFALSASGIGFAFGGVAGFVALLLFIFIGYPTTRRLAAIARRLEAERRPPSPTEEELLARYQSMLRPLGVVVPVLLAVALAAMATARYLPLLT
jgi:uncharacterized membrane protein